MGKASDIPAAQLALYDKLVATIPDVERKGASMPYTSRNGHMFSFLTKTGTLALRLPDEEREAFLKKYRTKQCEQHGTVMKEYAEVPGTLLKKTSELRRHFLCSYDYVGSLKPKPITRKKKAASAKKVTAKKTTASKKKTAWKKKPANRSAKNKSAKH